jgi:excisionase family DNA binding protein
MHSNAHDTPILRAFSQVDLKFLQLAVPAFVLPELTIKLSCETLVLGERGAGGADMADKALPRNRAERRARARDPEAEWLGIDEAAEYLNLPRRFILRLVSERRCRHYKHGIYVKFRKLDLDEWAKSECREPVR